MLCYTDYLRLSLFLMSCKSLSTSANHRSEIVIATPINNIIIEPISNPAIAPPTNIIKAIHKIKLASEFF